MHADVATHATQHTHTYKHKQNTNTIQTQIQTQRKHNANTNTEAKKEKQRMESQVQREAQEEARGLQFQLMSDVHLEYYDVDDNMPAIRPVAPYLVLLGDIVLLEVARKRKLHSFLQIHSTKFEKILLVKAITNCGTSLQEAVRFLQHLSATIPNVIFLDRSTFEVDGVRFIGCTLWTRIPRQYEREAW